MRCFMLIVGVLSVFAAVASAQDANRGNAQAGRQLALRACDACHIVTANQELRPFVPGYAPSFFDVADKPGTTAQSLQQYLTERHPYGNMPYPQLSAAQAADLASYILSLRTRR